LLQLAISLRQLRVRRGPPGAFDRLCRRSGPPILQHQSCMMGSRGCQIGCQRLRLAGKIETLSPVAARQSGEAALVQDDTAVVAGALARNDSKLDRLSQGVLGGLPASLARFEIEHTLDYPWRARPQGHRPVGNPQCGAAIARAQSLV